MLFPSRIAPLEVVKDIQVLSRRKQVKKHIVLRAYAHKLSDLIHFLKHVDVIHLGLALALLDQPSQHRDHGRLPRAVMPQQRKYLTVIHLHIHSTNSSESSAKGLLEILNFEEVTS